MAVEKPTVIRAEGAPKHPVLSIIVPVYNVEGYLDACLDSLQAQTFSDIEMVCVNDGSPEQALHNGKHMRACRKQTAERQKHGIIERLVVKSIRQVSGQNRIGKRAVGRHIGHARRRIRGRIGGDQLKRNDAPEQKRAEYNQDQQAFKIFRRKNRPALADGTVFL